MTVLRMGNHQTMGSVTTADAGNAARCVVHDIPMYGSSFSPPGSGFTARRVTGKAPRRIEILWSIACNSVDDLVSITRLLEAYILDGRDYELVVTDGRKAAMAVLVADGTGPQSPRITRPDGRSSQTWRLVFYSVKPSTVAGAL